MAEAKPEEISHPPMEQLQGFEYCIDSNPPWGAYPSWELKMLHIPVGIPLSESCSFSSFFGCPGEAIILAFQHYILALGTAVMIPAVLVPMMGGDDVSSPPASFVSVLAWY